MYSEKKKQFGLGVVSEKFIEKFKEAKKNYIRQTGVVISNHAFINYLMEEKYPELKDFGLF